MISFKKKTEQTTFSANSPAEMLKASIMSSFATIEFHPDGVIKAANEPFLKTLGYSLEEIEGQHHRLFVDEEEKNSLEYRRFWDELGKGNPQSREFKRITKSGTPIWINASYMPLKDETGRVTGVIKLAQDSTASRLTLVDIQGQVSAIGKSQAVIEFKMDGTILGANDNFLAAVGYSLSEIQGRHHSMFVDSNFTPAAEYKIFWEKLRAGEFQAAEYRRVGKDGKEIWIQASYNPIFDIDGKPFKVVKYATDITKNKLSNANFEGQLAAISKSQAVIEFNLDGTILTANDNFLATIGYSAEEIKGRHHGMFVDDAYRASVEYQTFWNRLRSGEFVAGEFRRVGKGGKEIWINASYNPIMGLNGKPIKVVKFASDITATKQANANFEGQLQAIGKAQAVIEFNLDGTIITANPNFLAAIGYSAEEIIGKHHSLFVDEKLRNSAEYQAFWSRLRSGEFVAGEFRRIGKGGKEIWINASYNPILGINGKPTKVVKFASEVTASKMNAANFEGQLAAISKSQAIIEFNLDGTIIAANDNFLSTLGYSLAEIKGKHHSIFVDESTRSSASYRSFWEKLNRGDYDSGQYCRISKDGREVWIQASYNPILDLNGKPYKVVKYATDITAMIELIKDLTDAANQLATSSSELNTAASEMSLNSARTNDEANAAANSSERVAKGVEEVATNTEEMQASIKEIARNANEASNMSSETKRQAVQTNNTIQKLGESSKEIGNVIKVISSIAQQTNLLALNATIEAARAGDAGRGFAVVANEVKELAKQTAKATEEITSKISAIQADSTDAVKAISGIGQSIEKLNAIAGAIAASVEEQAATTSEVARVVRESNSGVQGITDNVRSVSTAATQTSNGARQVMSSAKSLQELSGRLQSMVKSLRK